MSQPRDTIAPESISFDFSVADLISADAEAPETMCAAFQRTVAARGDAIALRTAGGGASYSWNEYAANAAAIAGGLAARGVKRGDPVALLLTNRPEFHFADTGAQHLGAVPFSCYNTSSPEQLGFLLRASGARVAISEQRLAAGLRGHLADPESPLELLILVDEVGEGEDGGGSHTPPAKTDTGTGEDGGGSHTPPETFTGTGEDGGGSHTPPAELEEVRTGEDGGGSHTPPAKTDTGTGEDGGGSHTPPSDKVVALADILVDGFDLAGAAERITPDDLLTLVYTSGTTGKPKGVEITHGNMVAMATATAPLIGVRAGDTLISFLPAAHIADRWASHYLNIWCGTEVTCLDDIRRLAPTIVEVRPTLFGGVPQVWTRIVAGIRAFPDPVMKAAIDQSIEIGLQHLRAERAGAVPEDLKALRNAADQRVLGPLRAKLGLDRVRVAVTAAAPTPPEVIEFVNAIGVPLIEAWGMSEISGMGTMVPLGIVRPGSAGRGHRHRRERDPAGPGHRGAGRARVGVPAQRPVDTAQTGPSLRSRAENGVPENAATHAPGPRRHLGHDDRDRPRHHREPPGRRVPARRLRPAASLAGA